MAPTLRPTLFEKIGASATLAQTLLVALVHFLTSPIRSGPRPSSLFKDVMFKALRYSLSNLTLTQEKWVFASTENNYLDLAKAESFQPDTLTLPSGCKAHWLGNPNAEKIIIYLHGGGYVIPCSPGHFKWIHELNQSLSKSVSISTIILGYTTSPDAVYPTQVAQAAELIHHLITVQGRKSSDMIIVGDSAGGNLSLALFSHILHPHPEVPTKLRLDQPFATAILISPWVNFDVNQPSMARNVQTDYLDPRVGDRWSKTFLGGAGLDNYNQPVLAENDWYAGLDSVVSEVLVWGGGAEVLIDSIDRLVVQLKNVSPKLEYVKEPGASHEDFIVEKLIGYTRKAQGTALIEEWISSRL